MTHAETYTYQKGNQLDLTASVYRSQKSGAHHTLLYFHGGGLLYGEKEDLPQEYIDLFVEAGFHFISFDYPLAPETELPAIYSSVKSAVEWFLENASDILSIDSPSYSLFGRSAGAYLCFLLAAEPDLPQPDRLIDFYGYESLQYEEFKKPNPHYQSYPALQETIVKRMIQPRPIASGPIQTRFALYIYARQTGKWLEFLGADQETVKSTFSLTSEDIKKLPPTFIAHSTADQDVPYKVTEKLKQEIPEVSFHPVTDKEHDFDRDPADAEAKVVYQKLIHWLQTES